MNEIEKLAEEAARKHFHSGKNEKELQIARIGFIEGYKKKATEAQKQPVKEFAFNEVMETFSDVIRLLSRLVNNKENDIAAFDHERLEIAKSVLKKYSSLDVSQMPIKSGQKQPAMSLQECKTAEQIALSYGLCTCDEAYKSRNLVAPDCPFHSMPVEEAMQEYANQFREDIWVKFEEEEDPICKTELYFFRHGISDFVYTGYFTKSGSFVDNEGVYYESDTVTHWMYKELPPPPKD